MVDKTMMTNEAYQELERLGRYVSSKDATNNRKTSHILHSIGGSYRRWME